MAKKEIKVTFRTITPLWTGDAWQNNSEIRSSSLIGSLRFWFEVICYFSNITNENNYENVKLKDEVNEKEFQQRVIENGIDFNGRDNTLAGLGITLPSRVFGCTGWKGWVKIKKINFDKNNFHNKLRGRIINNKNWFWGTPYYNGEFSIFFEVGEHIKDSIFYPLLTFIEKYGFLGGKWNIGYGRIKVEKVEEMGNGNWEKNDNWRKEEFNCEDKIKNFTDFIDINVALNMDSKSFEFLKYFFGTNTFYCNNERELKSKISSIPKKIKVVKFNNSNENYTDLIKKLLNKKAEMRDCLRPVDNIDDKKLWNNFRHKLLGTTSGGIEGTKIIPWIYDEGNQLKGGFISIAGILNLEG